MTTIHMGLQKEPGTAERVRLSQNFNSGEKEVRVHTREDMFSPFFLEKRVKSAETIKSKPVWENIFTSPLKHNVEEMTTER